MQSDCAINVATIFKRGRISRLVSPGPRRFFSFLVVKTRARVQYRRRRRRAARAPMDRIYRPYRTRSRRNLYTLHTVKS